MLLLLLLATCTLTLALSITSPLQPGPLRPALEDLIARGGASTWYHNRRNRHINAIQQTCANYDISAATLPPSSLPPPATGLKPYHIALGRGVQNYTCTSNTPTTAPTPKGAVATLFNASCAAWSDSTRGTNLLGPLAQLAYRSPSTPSSQGSWSPLLAAQIQVSGQHYFSDDTTPTFNLNMPGARPPTNYGIFFAKKNTATPANPIVGGQSSNGKNGQVAVPWLLLNVPDPVPAPFVLLPADQRPVRQIYRVNTIGGNAAAGDCTDKQVGEVFSVPYVAEYWFFA